jgi:hypothetical protein
MVFRHEGAFRRRQPHALIHSAVATPANVADHKVLPELLHGNETRVWSDQAYRGQHSAIRRNASRARDFANRRCRHCGVVNEADRAKNRPKSKVPVNRGRRGRMAPESAGPLANGDGGRGVCVGRKWPNSPTLASTAMSRIAVSLSRERASRVIDAPRMRRAGDCRPEPQLLARPIRAARTLIGGSRQGLRPARVDVQSDRVRDRKSPRDAASSPKWITSARASKGQRTHHRRCR